MTSSQTSFDVNCDMGESFGNWTLGADEELMPLITSANVACGFHASDPLTMARTVSLAREHGVAIGAHPGYPDLLGFGRRRMPLDPDEAAAYVSYQVGALRAFTQAAGVELHHVKPHGAFYALLRDESSLAEAVADAIEQLAVGRFYWPGPAHGVKLCDLLADRGVKVVNEVYPDLTYDASGNVVIQRVKRETDLEFVKAQMLRFLSEGLVETEEGATVRIEAQSACIHGDGPNAVAVAQAVREAIEQSGRQVAPIE